MRLCRDRRVVSDEEGVHAEMLPACHKKYHIYENYVIDYYTCGTKRNLCM
jgi:hypothetical protein